MTALPPSYSPELLALQQVVAGRYSIVRELGRGGMGIVVLAREVALERPVAIKLLPPALAEVPAHRERFVREARTAAALAHPNIVPIHSVEEHEEIVFFVMGFVDGETLAERVARAGPLSSGDAVRIVQEVSWALAHAHANDVVHRDVKPENILLERGSGRALVTDFGIAWVHHAMNASGEGKIVGTPRYMSPEQASGEPLDGRSDVYSLGAVAYFATTGRAPIDGTSSMAILAKQVSETPPSLAVARRDLPPRFVAAVDRCLAKDRASRWPSAEALAHALRSIGGNALEIAAPVRAFLRDADAAGNELSTAVTVGTTSVLMLAITLMQDSDTFTAGLARAFGVMLYVGTAASMTGLAGWRVWQLVDRARAFIRAGYSHSAIIPALDLEASRIEEERTPTPSSLKSTLLRTIAGVGATAASLWLAGTGIDAIELLGIGGSILAPTLTIRHLVSRTQGAHSWWHRHLRGAFGKTLFRAASVGLDASPAMPAIGEPTSLALGSAVEALFNALPDVQRKRFAELPGLVAKLERSAVELRRRTPDPDLDQRSTIVVAALESLRLDLLRLHAASASPDDLTRDLEAAQRIGDDIAAQLAARESVERIVRGELSPLPGDAATPTA